MLINSKSHSKKSISIESFDGMGGGFNVKIADSRGNSESLSLTIEEAEIVVKYMVKKINKTKKAEGA
jgi:hypothetical protein